MYTKLGSAHGACIRLPKSFADTCCAYNVITREYHWSLGIPFELLQDWLSLDSRPAVNGAYH